MRTFRVVNEAGQIVTRREEFRSRIGAELSAPDGATVEEKVLNDENYFVWKIVSLRFSDGRLLRTA